MMKQKATKKTSIGGQALIEGIMMRGPDMTAMAVYNPEGEIVLEKWETANKKRAKIAKAPFVRGIFNLIDSMRFGYKCLMRSGEIAGFEDEEPKKKNATEKADVTEKEKDADVSDFRKEGAAALASISPDAEETAETEKTTETKDTEGAAPEETEAATDAAQAEPAQTESAQEGEEQQESVITTGMMIVSVAIALLLGIGLFFFLPAQLFRWIAAAVPMLDTPVWRGIFEGVFRIVLFVGYMCLMLLIKDVKRTFMYHGAEHKTIFCYEKGLELTTENIRAQKRFHPRCGTSFMILVLLVGIVVSMFIQIDMPLLRTAIKILTLPIVVGIGYELIKIAGRFDNIITRIISAPGMWLQRITTVEPDDAMIACAIAAITEVIPENPNSDNW